jgi:hypothetical protein
VTQIHNLCVNNQAKKDSKIIFSKANFKMSLPTLFTFFCVLVMEIFVVQADYSDIQSPLQINGIFPSLTSSNSMSSSLNMSEIGTGALMPWGDYLYTLDYLRNPGAGSGAGLYRIDKDMKRTRIANHTSCYANRMIHRGTNSIVMGPYKIDSNNVVSQFDSLMNVRIGGMSEHLEDPDNKVYLLGMEGEFWEADLVTMKAVQLFDLCKELDFCHAGEQQHGKAAFTRNGITYVAFNTFEEADFIKSATNGNPYSGGGRFASWNGKGNWTVLETTAFMEVTGRTTFGGVVYALGWDSASVILKVLQEDGPGCSSNQLAPVASTETVRTWQTYRLPKASHAYDHLWQTEWPRIREVETERYLFDMHGLFYELSPLGWAGSTWGVRPVSQHLRMIPDFCSWNGLLVLGGNQVTPHSGANLYTGQAQTGLWFGKTDDLWSLGKVQGWGGPWRSKKVEAGQQSDPYLMTGFDKKVLHLHATTIDGSPITDQIVFTIQVDFTGTAGSHKIGEPWHNYTHIGVPSKSTGAVVPSISSASAYSFHAFPEGFSAHWVRIVAHSPCIATAYFHYT